MKKIDIKAYVIYQENICQNLYNLQKTYTKTLEISEKKHIYNLNIGLTIFYYVLIGI